MPKPNHDSYPSGHALQAYLMAFAMVELMGDFAEQTMAFMEIADRIAENREFAGVHYPSDSAASQDIARFVFPILRTIFWDVFDAAVRATHETPLLDCHLRRQARYLNAGAEPVREIEASESFGAELPWHQVAIGMNTPQDPTAPSRPVVVGLIDTAIDVTHPDLMADRNSVIKKQQRFNLDFPCLHQEGTAFASTGTGHGTAMAAIIAGQGKHAPLGIAGHAKISAARISTFLNASHENRMSLASLVLDMSYQFIGQEGDIEDRLCALILGPPIAAPDKDDFLPLTSVSGATENQLVGDGADLGTTDDPILDPEEFPAIAALVPENINSLLTTVDSFDQPMRAALVETYLELEAAPCDPLLLSLLCVERRVPVVIPSGNEGAKTLPYPMRPEDYAYVKSALSDPFRRVLAALMLLEVLGFDPQSLAGEDDKVKNEDFGLFATWVALEELVQDLPEFDSAEDPFAGTGIIVVGAGVPLKGLSDGLSRAAYSNEGRGLTLLAPSYGDADQRTTCNPVRYENYDKAVPTADLLGPGGFALDPNAQWSGQDGERGFGGTSAASAIVAGMIARLAEAKGTGLPEDWGRQARTEIEDRWGTSPAGGLNRLAFKPEDL